MIKIIKFYGENCNPCKIFQPIREEVKSKNKNIEFESINIDHDMDGYTEYYGVRSIPFIVIENDGIVVNKHAGIMMPKEFQNFIDTNTQSFNQ